MRRPRHEPLPGTRHHVDLRAKQREWSGTATIGDFDATGLPDRTLRLPDGHEAQVTLSSSAAWSEVITLVGSGPSPEQTRPAGELTPHRQRAGLGQPAMCDSPSAAIDSPYFLCQIGRGEEPARTLRVGGQISPTLPRSRRTSGWRHLTARCIHRAMHGFESSTGLQTDGCTVTTGIPRRRLMITYRFGIIDQRGIDSHLPAPGEKLQIQRRVIRQPRHVQRQVVSLGSAELPLGTWQRPSAPDQRMLRLAVGWRHPSVQRRVPAGKRGRPRYKTESLEWHHVPIRASRTRRSGGGGRRSPVEGQRR
jgi:hypothetical protein